MIALNNRGNWTLLGVVIAMAIVVILAVYLFAGTSGTSTVRKNSDLLDSKSEKKTVVGASLDTARAHVCREQLGQIRQGIQAYKATEATEANPATLKDIGLSVGEEFYKCPVSNKPYTYDAATAEVKCPTHDRY